jgi:hypothetical protein
MFGSSLKQQAWVCFANETVVSSDIDIIYTYIYIHNYIYMEYNICIDVCSIRSRRLVSALVVAVCFLNHP